MMPRPPTFVLWLATLASGFALGFALSNRGATLSAQSSATPVSAPSGVAQTIKGSSEDAIYREIGTAYDRFQGVDRIFELVSRAVSPAVVHITARKIGQRDDGDVGRVEETGSGVIVRSGTSKGLFVLTNNHVVDGSIATDISILLHDGQILKPERFWADPMADVAVLKLNREDLPTARLGNSDDARIGTWVMAVGSPFGLTHSVSQGIISARGRYEQELEMDGVEHQEFLQTDAAINPGNSGGPLVNMRGEVVGLNTAIASAGGGSEGVGFSIPINLAKWAMSQLVTNGKVSRGAMGVNLQELSHVKATELGLERPRGARIVVVHDASPASEAGLVVDDVVLRFNGVEVSDNNHLINLVSMSPIGHPSELVIWRNRKRLTAKVVIADRDRVISRTAPVGSPRPKEGPLRRSPRPATPPGSDSGIVISPLDDATRSRLFGEAINKVQGVLVTTVEPSSPFARYLQSQDVIETIGTKTVDSPDAAQRALRRTPGDAPIEIGLRRMLNGTMQKRGIRIP